MCINCDSPPNIHYPVQPRSIFYPPVLDEDGVDLPYGRYGIRPGYYTLNEVVQMLRDRKDNPDAVQYIADMLEE